MVRHPRAQGSRLRLILRSLNDPGDEKNWNSAKPVADQTSAGAHREQSPPDPDRGPAEHAHASIW